MKLGSVNRRLKHPQYLALSVLQTRGWGVAHGSVAAEVEAARRTLVPLAQLQAHTRRRARALELKSTVATSLYPVKDKLGEDPRNLIISEQHAEKEYALQP